MSPTAENGPWFVQHRGHQLALTHDEYRRLRDAANDSPEVAAAMADAFLDNVLANEHRLDEPNLDDLSGLGRDE